MAKFNAEQHYFSYDNSGGSLQDISPYLNELDGLPGAGELREITAGGDTVGKKWFRGLENVVITGRGLYDNTANSLTEIMVGARTETTTRSFEYGPEGNGSGAPKYSGECFAQDVKQPMRIGDMQRFAFALQVDGGVTIGTFA